MTALASPSEFTYEVQDLVKGLTEREKVTLFQKHLASDSAEIQLFGNEIRNLYACSFEIWFHIELEILRFFLIQFLKHLTK